MAITVDAHIDLTGIATIEEFHKRMRTSMALPDYYGDNLDSLHDIMSEMSGRIRITGSEMVDEDMLPYVGKFKAMCIHAGSENPLLDILIV